MPVPIIANDKIKVRVVCHTANQISVNIFHFVVDAVRGTVTDQDLANAVDLSIAPEYVGLIFNGATYRGVGVTILRVPSLTEVTSVASTSTGLAGPLPMSMQTCGMITKKTVLGGRANRGRTYLPFPSTSDSDAAGNVPTAGYAVRAGILAGKMLLSRTFVRTLGVDEVDVTPTLVRRHVGPPVTYTQKLVTGSSLPLKWGTQKRRGNYGKPNVVPF